jgi:hypothetical protein
MKTWQKVLYVLSPFIIVGTVLAVSYPRHHREKTACEAQDRFYWRGHCLPKECAVIHE